MPPVEAHAPIEMAHLGWGIWSQMRRITGASLNGRRPAQIRTSACRGEKLCRSIPKREMSNREAAVAMYSMAQQAVPKGIGQRELDRAQLARKSSRVVTQLGEANSRASSGLGEGGNVSPIAAPPASRRRRSRPPGSR